MRGPLINGGATGHPTSSCFQKQIVNSVATTVYAKTTGPTVRITNPCSRVRAVSLITFLGLILLD